MKRILFAIGLFICFGVKAQYNPSLHAGPFNKPMGINASAGTDARSYYYDASNFVYRPYISTSEVLTYLNLAKYRTGQFDIIINQSGSLSGGGVLTGGINTVWYFKNGTADSNLVQKVFQPITDQWKLTGNSGTVDQTNFLGTTTNIPLSFKVNNFFSGRIDNTQANTFFGYRSGGLITSANNTAIGFGAMLGNSSGGGNTAIGTQSMFGNTFGNNNTSVGYSALQNNTTGGSNTILGYNTGGGLTTGSFNTIIGANVTGLSGALSNNIIIADGQGIRRITVDDAGTVVLGSITALGLPSGNTAQRPSSPATGYLRYNTDSAAKETYNGSAWVKDGSGGGGGGSVTNVATGFGLSGGPITTTGTVVFDSTAATGFHTLGFNDARYQPRNTIAGLITAGTNVSLSGAGTLASPYSISSTATGDSGIIAQYGLIKSVVGSNRVLKLDSSTVYTYVRSLFDANDTITIYQPGTGLKIGKALHDSLRLATPIAGTGITITPNADTTEFTIASTGLSSTLTSGNILVGNVSNVATSVTMSGDATIVAGGALTIANNAITTAKIINNAVTFAKMQPITANRLLGSGLSGTAVAEITLGTGLSFTGTTLNASASSADSVVYWTNMQKIGADTSGVTDCTPLIRYAMTLKKPLYFPHGKYKISSEVTLLDSVVFRGDGMNSSRFILTTNITAFHATSTSGKDFQIYDMGFVGTFGGTGNTNQKGIVLDTVSRCIIQRVGGYFMAGFNISMKGNAYLPFNDFTNGNKVLDCYFETNYGGVLLDERAEYNTITSTTVGNGGTYGFFVTGGNNLITACNANTINYGLYLNGGSNDGHGIATGNNFNHCNTANVYATAVANGFTLNNNHIYSGAITVLNSDGIVFNGGDIAVTTVTLTNATACYFDDVRFVTEPTWAVTTSTGAINRQALGGFRWTNLAYPTKPVNISSQDGIIYYGLTSNGSIDGTDSHRFGQSVLFPGGSNDGTGRGIYSGSIRGDVSASTWADPYQFYVSAGTGSSLGILNYHMSGPISGLYALRVDNAGSTGIRVENPTAVLDVNGTIRGRDSVRIDVIATGNSTDSILVINPISKVIHKVAQTSSINIYNTDGVLTGDRVFLGANHSLTIGDLDASSPMSSIFMNATSTIGLTSTGSILLSAPQTNISSGLLLKINAVNATYAILDNDYTINCTANTFTVTLPDATTRTGQTYTIKNSGAGVITIATTSSQTIDGTTTKVLATQFLSATVQSDGANWIVL